MKSYSIHPEENRYDFTLADQFVEFGEAHNMYIVGHTLIWHSQLSYWFCIDENGNDVSAEVLKERMKEHISTIVGRYKGRVKGWDVVNEAIEDDGSFRKSKFYEILGEEYLILAFQYAAEADPDAELYYNDFSMSIPAKREGVIKLVRLLKENGCRIDGVGMQCHIGMDYPSIADYEESIIAYGAEGVKVMITEMDMTALPAAYDNTGANVEDNVEYRKEINPYTDGLPASVSAAWNKRMLEFFRLFVKYEDVIDRVTMWGVTDGDSWRNDWPVRGRTDYPLLFDREYKMKPFVSELAQELKSNK